MSNPQVRQRVADGIDDFDEVRMGFLETFDGRTQSLNGKFAQLRILFRARGLVGRQLGEAGDAPGLFIVRFFQNPDLGLECAQQLEQFALAVVVDGIRAADARLNFANRFFVHDFHLEITRCRQFGKRAK